MGGGGMRSGHVLCLVVVILCTSCRARAEERRPRAILALDASTLEGPKAEDVRVAFTLWMDEMLKDAGLVGRMQTVILQPDHPFVEAARRGEGDMFVLNSLRFLQIREKVALDPALVNVRAEGVGDSLILLVRKGAAPGGIPALKGGALLLCNAGKGSIPKLWVDVLVAEAGLGPESHWSSVRSVIQPIRSVLPVFFGKADACVVTAEAFAVMTELNPQLGRELEVLCRSERLLDTVSAWRRDFVDDELRRALETWAGRIDTLPTGRQILTLYRVRSIRLFEEGHLDGIRNLVARARAVLPDFAARMESLGER